MAALRILCGLREASALQASARSRRPLKYSAYVLLGAFVWPGKIARATSNRIARTTDITYTLRWTLVAVAICSTRIAPHLRCGPSAEHGRGAHR